MQRQTQGTFTSSSTNSDPESMRSAQNAAISSNEKVFPIFAKKLASKDFKEFANTARKLADWLGSEKAYYPAARPKIVELLEIALSAFTDTFMLHSASAELAELLRKLVDAVKPFRRLFLEPEFQSRLQRVIIDTEQSFVLSQRIISNVPTQGAVSATSPFLVFPVDVRLSPNMPTILGPRKLSLPAQPISTQDTVRVAPVIDGSVSALRARNPADAVSSQTDANASPTSPIKNTPQGSNFSPSVPSKPQPKRARKAELSEDLIARDLDWFKLNQPPAATRKESSTAGGPSSLLTSDATNVLGRSPSLKKKTARIVPSRRLPRRVPPDAAQTAESGPGSLPPPSEDASAENANEQWSSPEKAAPDAQFAAILEAHDMQAVSSNDLPYSKPQLPATSPNGLPIEPEVPQTEHRSAPVKALSLRSESSISRRPSISLLEPALDRSDPMDISASDLAPGVLSEPSPGPGPTSPESPAFQFRSLVLPPLVDAWDPPLNLNFDISQIRSDQLLQSASDANRERFDGEMSVIHSVQGRSFTHTHTIDISLEESIFTKISRWVNRRSQPSEAPHGVCISLACYRLPEIFSKANSGTGQSDVEALTLQTSCSWPNSNQLSLHVNDEAGDTIVTLSPPLFLTPDQCVDVSSLMKLGTNTFEIKQYGDLSEYLMILHAHHPTRAQLSEFDVIKIADERWKRFLDALSARIPPVTSAGVVGAA